jgi:histidine triad (HIT) family protein
MACLFCDIVAGKIPAHLVHEAPGALAFLDVHPTTRGHVLVIPRAHATNLVELADDGVGELFKAVKVVQQKLSQALQPVAFNVGWNHGAAAGQHVFHLHVHVLPRYGPGGRGVQALGAGAGPEDLAALAATLRAVTG